MVLLRQAWIWVFIIGVMLFVAAILILQAGNDRFFSTVVVLGALIVPATMVTYIGGYERRLDRGLHATIPAGSVIWAFIAGGLIGVVTAGAIEFATLSTLGIPQLFGVGLIEESAKMILPVIIFIRARYRSDADGLLFGIASGMGFAALETIGYGFATYQESQVSLGTVGLVLLIRGLVSPAGHAAWTGLVCAALWHERNRAGRPVFSLLVLGAFLLAVLLHAAWNIVGSIKGLPASAVIAGYLVIAVVGLTMLTRWIRHAGSVKEGS